MDIAALKTELTTDPLGLGLAGLSNQEAADKLNEVPTAPAVGRRLVREVIPTWEIFEATTAAEWTGLSANEKQRYQTMLAMGTVNIRQPNTRATLLAMFGPATTTRANLDALRYSSASRAMVLLGESVNYWDVANARLP